MATDPSKNPNEAGLSSNGGDLNGGDLPQSGPARHLMVTRRILIGCAVAILSAGWFGLLFSESIRKEVRTTIGDDERLETYEKMVTEYERHTFGTYLALGFVTLFLAFSVEKRPVPIALLALGLYVVTNAILLAVGLLPLDLRIIVTHLLIVVFLVSAVLGAFSFRRGA